MGRSWLVDGVRMDGSASCWVGGISGLNKPWLRGQKFSFTTPSGVNTITSLRFVSCAPLASAAMLERLLRKGSTVGEIPRLFRMSRRVNIVTISRGDSSVVLFEEGLQAQLVRCDQIHSGIMYSTSPYPLLVYLANPLRNF